MSIFRLFPILMVIVLAPNPAMAALDLKFDVVTFCCHCAPDDTLCQPQFDRLNFQTTNGHYIAMGSDAHRLELATNGNGLAIYYNTFNDGWPTNTGAQQAARVDQYAIDGFTSTGPKPNWVVLNEISTSLWQSDSNYRAWVHDVVHALKASYGYNVILYSPFANPGANSSDWQAVSTDAYIGVENYLSGSEILAHSFSVSWCQSQYQTSITSYTGLGVLRARLMLGEDFSQTTTGTSYGRSGVSSNDWDSAILARNQGAENVAFAGYLTYAWSKNAMLATDDELVHYEDTYRTNHLPSNTGLTAPAIVLQPQGQTVPSGSDVSFIVFKAGTAPTTYQWRFNGTNLPGLSGSALSLSNVQVSNSGNYSVVLNNSAGTVTSSNAFLKVAVPDPIGYEPFASAQTSYAPGSNLIGQTNAIGQRWTQAGPDSTNQPTIVGGSLLVGGLDGPAGNRVRFGGNGTSARFDPGTNISAGTWFYSFAVSLSDITGLSASGVFWAGFNNSTGTQTNTPTSVCARVLTRSSGAGFNIGLDKSSGSPASFVFATNVFATNETIFLVASYTFDSGSTTDDVARLWINPPASSFGQANPPPADLTNSAGTDLGQLASFVLFNRNTGEPAQGIFDEFRLGTSWASVTDPAESQTIPALRISRAGTLSTLSWTTNAPGFVLESSPAVSGSTGWSRVSGPVYLTGSDFVITNAGASGVNFYRLRKP